MPLLPSPPDASAPRMAPRRRRHMEKRKSGAWKVAYADFVTALMALFIVLWMLSASSKVKESVAGYFHDPRGYTRRLGAGPAGAGEGLPVNRSNIATLQDQIAQALRRMPEFEKLKDNIRVSVTGEGLRIDLMESEQGLFFISGSPEPTGAGQELLHLIAGEIGRMPNRIVIEGHTDARPFHNAAPDAKYANWELSTDRANAARRLLYASGIAAGHVAEVRGFADQKLLHPEDPNDPRNRRVSLVVRFTNESE